MDDRTQPPTPEDGPTLPMGSRVPTGAPFPVRNWGSYELLEYLGSGAMGSVYKAIDHRLGRHVAIKFLMGDDPALIERFQQEARAQARVEHENLCKVYEVGQVEARHYIAMQFIDGQRLSAASRKMTLPEKILAMRDIADGLHEAHRAGLIHRDIKPGNIMVSRSEDGRWKPFVLDFGLARVLEESGMTMTGAVIGTPSYMAPEQARGEIHKLDRRSDVYGLGATLYAMLTHRPPFEGGTAHEVIPKVLHDVPVAPRELHPEVPADVESIVLKCLRKDPADRYDSARALAEDLGRYLDGEPVVARPTTAWYRLRIRARKNRVAVRVAAIALPVILAAVGWAVWNQWTSVRQQQLAQDFGQRVQRIESMARVAAMAPLHDIRPERESIRSQMAAIQTATKQLGKIARGPGEYAIGRGHLALDELADARTHLQAAWDNGHRRPEVSYGLGLVLSRLYALRLEELATIRDEEERKEKRAQAEAALRDPALEHLRNASSVATESPAYLEGLIAYCEDRTENAITKARAAFALHTWLYEAKRLEGEIYLSLAHDATSRGEHDSAGELYAQSTNSFATAATVAPSDPNVHTDLGRVALARVTLQIQHLGGDITPAADEGMAAVEKALRANPDDGPAFGLRASFHRRIAEYRIEQGQPASEHLDAAIAAATRGVQLSPSDASIYRTLGETYRQIGRDVRGDGGDPRPAFAEAIAAYDTAGKLAPDGAFFNNLGLLHKDVAVYQAGIGEDPRNSYRSAFASYERSIALRPKAFATHYNLGAARNFLASYELEHGVDPRETYARAMDAYRAALVLSPRHAVVLQSLASALNNLADFELTIGQDPAAHTDEALKALTQAIESNPASSHLPHFRDGRGISYTTRARHRLLRGEDPSTDAELAIQEFEAAIAANSSYSFAHANLADACAVMAEYRCETGAEPGSFVDRARRAGRTALTLDPSETYANVPMAGAVEALARYQLAAGQSPTAATEQLRTYAAALLAADSTDAEAYRRLGTALSIQAAWSSRRANATPLFDDSIRQLDRARELNPNRADILLALAEAHVRWAEADRRGRRPPDEQVAAGMAAAEAALAANPLLENRCRAALHRLEHLRAGKDGP